MVEQLFAVRPARPSDAAGVEALCRGLSRRSMTLRFLGAVSPDTAVAEVCREIRGDGGDESFVAVLPGGEVVGEAYAARTAPDAAEVAFVVADRWQHRGVGTALFAAVLERLRAAGVHSVCAETLVENVGMRRLLRDTGLPLREEGSMGELTVHLRLGDVVRAPAAALFTGPSSCVLDRGLGFERGGTP